MSCSDLHVSQSDPGPSSRTASSILYRDQFQFQTYSYAFKNGDVNGLVTWYATFSLYVEDCVNEVACEAAGDKYKLKVGQIEFEIILCIGRS